MKPARRHALHAAATLALALAPLLGTARAAEAPAEVDGALPQARLQGAGRLTFLGLRIYDAQLWTTAPLEADWTRAEFALVLVYARGLVGRLIAERSLAEMRRQAEISDEQAQRWQTQLGALLPDVRVGDRITGLNRPGAGLRLFVNGKPSGDIADTEFARLFFGIWLAPQTSEPALRKALLGGRG